MNWNNAIRTTIVCAILIMLQYSLRPLLDMRDSRVQIDFLLIALVFGSVRMRPGLAALFGLALGLVSDSLSATALGASALGMTVVGFAASWLKAVFFADNLALNAFFLFVGKWLLDLIFLTAEHRVRGGEIIMQIFVWFPLSAAVTAGVGVLALLLFRPLMEVRTA